MKETRLIKTPEGVRDILPEECEKKLLLERELMETMGRFGFRPIETPTFEFFDLFSREIGTTPAKDLYKFFDREGNTLVLRPDVTPQIVRAFVSFRGEKNIPLRFSYRGNTYINHHSYTLRPKEITQVGAELMGETGVQADAEMIAMCVECLKTAGLTEFQIGIGHAGYLSALTDSAGLIEEQKEELDELLNNRNYFGVTEMIKKQKLEPDLSFLFESLGDFYSSTEEMKELMQRSARYPKVQEILNWLCTFDHMLSLYGVQSYVTYELGQLPPFRYYTGIIFDGYTYDAPEPLVKGGRYDSLLRYFGNEEGALGFAFRLDTLQQALSRQHKGKMPKCEVELMMYEENCLDEAIKAAKRLREEGKQVELMEYREGVREEVLSRYVRFTVIREEKA